MRVRDCINVRAAPLLTSAALNPASSRPLSTDMVITDLAAPHTIFPASLAAFCVSCG